MRIANKYLLFGISLGILFPLISLICDTVFVNGLAFNGGNILMTYRSSFLHVIISTAPIFLGASFLIAGIKAEKMEQNNLRLKANNQSLLEMNHILDEFNYRVTHDLKTSLVEMESLSLMIKKHSTNEIRRNEIILKLLSSSKNGTLIVNEFTRKVDVIRDDIKDRNSDDSDTQTNIDGKSIINKNNSLNNLTKSIRLNLQLSVN